MACGGVSRDERKREMHTPEMFYLTLVVRLASQALSSLSTSCSRMYFTASQFYWIHVRFPSPAFAEACS